MSLMEAVMKPRTWQYRSLAGQWGALGSLLGQHGPPAAYTPLSAIPNGLRRHMLLRLLVYMETNSSVQGRGNGIGGDLSRYCCVWADQIDQDIPFCPQLGSAFRQVAQG